MTEGARLPKINSVAGKAGRIVFARLSRGLDFVGSLEKVCKKHNIKGGSLVSCVGSFDQMVLHIPPPKGGAGFAPPVKLQGAIQIEGCEGIVGTAENGEPFIHLHVTVFCNDEKRIYGGHLRKGENRVASTMEVAIATVEGMDVSYKMFPEIDPEPTLVPEDHR